MKLFKPFPVAGRLSLASLFCCTSVMVSGQDVTSLAPTPSPTLEPAVPAMVEVFHCSGYSSLPGATPSPAVSTSCCTQLDVMNRQACTGAFDPAIHRRIKTITGNGAGKVSLEELFQVGPEPSVLPTATMASMEDPCILDDNNCTLFIFDSSAGKASSVTTMPTPTPGASSGSLQVEYDLPLGFQMPFNSAFVGNRKGDRLPELTIIDSGNSAYVITASDPQSEYYFADIEINSRGSHTPMGTLDLRGAKSVTLKRATVVRDPNTETPSGIIHAITLGCPNGVSPQYRIVDSEIDIVRSYQVGGIFPINFRTGDALYVTGCGGSGEGKANLKLSNTDVVIDASAVTGTVFNVNSLENATGDALEFLPGSICNRVVEVLADGTRKEISDHGELQNFLQDQTNTFNSINKVISGVVGLASNWGWGFDLGGSEYHEVLISWDDWAIRQCGIDLRCPDTLNQYTVTVTPTACSSSIAQEPSSTEMGGSSYSMLTTGTPALPGSPTTADTRSTVGSLNRSSSPVAVTSTPTETLEPTPLPPGAEVQDFDSCQTIQTGEDTMRDRAVCDEAYGQMNFSGGITKIPATVTDLSGVITEGNRLYIFDAAGMAADSGSSSIAAPTPTPGEEMGSGDQSLVQKEYDLPAGFTMPDDSAFVGNRKGGMRPEITVKDGVFSEYIIRVNSTNASFLFLHVEIDSREVTLLTTPTPSPSVSPVPKPRHAEGILNLNGAGNVVLDDVKLVRRGGATLSNVANLILRQGGYVAIQAGCAGNPKPSITVKSSVIDISEPWVMQDIEYVGAAFSAMNCEGAEKSAQFLLSNNRVIIQPASGSSFLSSGSVFFLPFASRESTLLTIQNNSICNEIVSPGVNGRDISDNRNIYILSLAAQAVPGVFGLKNSKGWGTQGIDRVLKPRCFWLQGPEPVDVFCPSPSQSLPASCAMSSTIQPARSTSTPVMGLTTSPGIVSSPVLVSSSRNTLASSTAVIAKPTPTPTPTPKSLPVLSSCDDNVNPLTDSDDNNTCSDYFQGNMKFSGSDFQHIVKIPRDITNPAGHLTLENTLYIFDSTAGDNAEENAEPMQAVYRLPQNFSMPSGSAFVGNRKRGLNPEFTVSAEARSGFVITGNQAGGRYYLARIEVDSRGTHSPEGVLDFKGALTVVMDDVTVVRDLAGSPAELDAVRLGCTQGQQIHTFRITDSLLDISAIKTTVAGGFVRGDAILITGCTGSAQAEILFSGNTIKIDDSPDNISSGVAFKLPAQSQGLFVTTPLNAPDAVRFLPGSTCNKVVNKQGANIAATHMRQPDIPGLASNLQRFLGVVGLFDDEGWGIRGADGGEYTDDVLSWCYWQQNQGVNVSCPASSVITPACTSTVAAMPTVAGTSTGPSIAATTLSTYPSGESTSVTPASAKTVDVSTQTGEASLPGSEPTTVKSSPSESSVLPSSSPTPSPVALTGYSCKGDNHGKDPCCNQIPSGHDRDACKRHYRDHHHNVYIIDQNQTDLSRVDFNDKGRSLFLFDSVDSNGSVIEYSLPRPLTLPLHTTLAGNLKGNKRPRLTPKALDMFTVIEYIIGGKELTGDYFLEDIEVDPKGETHSRSVLGFIGVNRVYLNNVVIHAEKPGQYVRTAIELGWKHNPVFPARNQSVEIYNSEVVLPFATVTGTIPRGAIDISGCATEGSQLNLTAKNNIIRIDDGSGLSTRVPTPTPSSAPGVSFGRKLVFEIRPDNHCTGASLHFNSGSTCNRVINQRGEDISEGHMGEVTGQIGREDLITGVFGLSNGLGWGWRPSDSSQGTFVPELESWCYWQQNQGANLSCPGSSVITPACTSTVAAMTAVSATPTESSIAATTLSTYPSGESTSGTPASAETVVVSTQTGEASLPGPEPTTVQSSPSESSVLPSSTPTPPPAELVSYSCTRPGMGGNLGKEECCNQLGSSPDDPFRTACKKHHQHDFHRAVYVIRHDQTDLRSVDFRDKTSSMFLFESVDSNNAEVTYILPFGFVQPKDTTISGNLAGNKKPRLTTRGVPDSNNSNGLLLAVIKGDQSDGHYLLADLEVDSASEGSHIPLSVLDFEGVRELNLSNILIKAVPGGYPYLEDELKVGLQSINLGCSDGERTPRVTITDSELDLLEAALGEGQTTVSKHQAIKVSNCQTADKKLRLLLSNNTFRIDDDSGLSTSELAPAPTPDVSDSSGFVFKILDENGGTGTVVNFERGSTCNRVINQRGEDISEGHVGEVADTRQNGVLDGPPHRERVITGVFGLSNGLGWGWRPSKSPHGGHDPELEPWCYWQQNQGVNVSCPSSSVIIPACTPTVAAMPTVVTPSVTGTPQGSTTSITPTPGAKSAGNSATSAGAIAGYTIASLIVTTQVISHVAYPLARHYGWPKVAATAKLTGIYTPLLLWKGVSWLYALYQGSKAGGGEFFNLKRMDSTSSNFENSH
ncbi:MAG: hypothetical protein ACR2PT_09610 [Endozoicomonas sp.]